MKEKIKIRIDIESIKRNPNAGSRKKTVPLGTNITFACKGLPGYLKDGSNCHITKWDSEQNFEGVILDNELVDKLMTEPDMQVTNNTSCVTISHFPEPDYYYKYQDQKIKCNNCGVSISYSELLELDNDSDDFAYTDTACPKCKAWDCCDIELETISEALIRQKIKL